MNARRWLLSGGFSLGGMAIRVPFASRYLYHWDSVNFALSLTSYNVTLHQPHPPGYILYSLLGRAINQLLKNANASLVLISLVAGALGVGIVFWLGSEMFGDGAGIAAATMTLLSPLHWFQSDVALSYALEFALVTMLAGLIYLQLSGRRRLWLISTLVFVIVGGVRQTDLLFMGPLWLYGLRPYTRRERIYALTILAIGVCLWLWPMVVWSGGWSSYVASLLGESAGVGEQASLFSLTQLGLNTGRMVIFLGYAMLLGYVPLAWAAISWVREGRWHDVSLKVPFVVLGLWMAPPMAFGILVHIRQSGHVFSFLPAVCILVGWSIAKLVAHLHRDVAPRISLASILLPLAVPSALFFLFAPAALFGSSQTVFQTPSAASIRQQDRELGERFAYIRGKFNPEMTVVIAGGLDFRHVDFYLPDYQMTDISYRLGDTPEVLPRNVTTLVLFNEDKIPDVSPRWPMQVHEFPDGSRLWYLQWPSGSTVSVSMSAITVHAP